MTSAETVGLFSVLSAALTFVLTSSYDWVKRRQDSKNHSIEIRRDRANRLQETRVAAYREFLNTFAQYRRLMSELDTLWNDLQLWSENDAGSDLLGEQKSIEIRERLEGNWRMALPEVAAATERLSDVLNFIRIVATTDVSQRAGSLFSLTDNTFLLLRLSKPAPTMEGRIDHVAQLQTARRQTEEGEEKLIKAIRDELGTEIGQK
ncbi:MAG: hypothetical protein HKL81_04545 [Acidimicrobiaceae bacterium]|nr:hypothetical protein [Acidimicrobiaceae bacterium]